MNEDYKYNCSTLDYLRMESGLIPVPEDSKDTYIVIPAKIDDLGIVGDKVYIFNGSDWEYFSDYEDDFSAEVMNNDIEI